MKKLDRFITKNFNDNEINHAYSIILRTWYEIKNMKKKKKKCDFILEQMNNFIVEYSNNEIIIKIKNEKFKLTEKELNEYVEYIYKYFNEKYDVNYDYRMINPIYFSIFFYDIIDKIIYIKEDTINLADIRLLRFNAEPGKLEDSERYKRLVDKNYKMISPFKSNLVIETPEERLQSAYESIKENGYGLDGQYAIFYNDEPYIRDGQHRVASLKYLYGDIDVKILRVYLKNKYFY